jgi:MFS family permease
VVGLLFAAPAVGAFVGAATSGWVGRIRHQGLAVIWAVVVWGAGIAAFGLVGAHLWLGFLFLAIAGAADVISAVFRNTILQVTVPEHLRGRLFGIHILVVTGGPRLGDLEAGWSLRPSRRRRRWSRAGSSASPEPRPSRGEPPRSAGTTRATRAD